ncbi:hypothetical protein ACT7CW_01330 [Bacillus pacificus]
MDANVKAYYNESINIQNILIQQRGGSNMEIAMAVLKFLGGVIPLVQELFKSVYVSLFVSYHVLLKRTG